VPKPDTVTPPCRRLATDVQADFSEPVVREPTPPPTDTPKHSVSRRGRGPRRPVFPPERATIIPRRRFVPGNEGISTVSVCVDPRGRLPSPGRPSKNRSGFARLVMRHLGWRPPLRALSG